MELPLEFETPHEVNGKTYKEVIVYNIEKHRVFIQEGSDVINDDGELDGTTCGILYCKSFSVNDTKKTNPKGYYYLLNSPWPFKTTKENIIDHALEPLFARKRAAEITSKWVETGGKLIGGKRRNSKRKSKRKTYKRKNKRSKKIKKSRRSFIKKTRTKKSRANKSRNKKSRNKKSRTKKYLNLMKN